MHGVELKGNLQQTAVVGAGESQSVRYETYINELALASENNDLNGEFEKLLYIFLKKALWFRN